MGATKNYARAIIPRGVRNWLRSPSRSVRWAWSDLKYAVGLNETVEMRTNFSLVCHPGAYNFAYHLQHTDAEQVVEFEDFIDCARPGMVLFDIGAHFGLFSLAALHYGGPKSVAVAVDPSPTAVRIVKIQAQLNNVSERLHVLKASVGEHAGAQRMVAVGVLASGYYVSPNAYHTASELTVTDLVTLDDLVRQYEHKPTHLKIDVEGDESAVLRGARELLSGSDAPLIFLELHNQIVIERGGDPHEPLDILGRYGYIVSFDNRRVDDRDLTKREIMRVIARKS